MNLIPLNPNVSLGEKDVLKRPLFRNDDIILNTMTSKEFIDLLLTDPTTPDGQDKIATYFNVTEEWAKVKQQGKENGKISDCASTYHYLLLTVKCQSNKDYIWMSFYEGLHRHSALLLSLTSSAFNLTKNEIKFQSLTTDYFEKQQLENFKKDSKQTPHERLNDIFEGKVNAKMLSEPFNLKAIIPKKVVGVTISLNAVAKFTKKITKYSEIISNSKKTSAVNSTSSLLSKTLQNDQQMSTPEDRNTTTIGPVLHHTYKIQGQIKKDVHKKNMTGVVDDFEVYKYCELLHTQKWDEFINNPLNDKAKQDFIDEMTNRSSFVLSTLSEEEKRIRINKNPPYAITFEGMTSDVGQIINGVRKVDPRHFNGYLMIPSIVTVLHAKIKNEMPSKIVADPTNKHMINFICRYAFLTRAYNQNSTHPVVAEYLPEVRAEYLNMCKGTYQVIPVAVFIMTLYNACFMYQTDNTDNLLIKALE